MSNSPLMVCVALASVVTVLPGPVVAQEDQCIRADGQIRRIEIVAQDRARGVPCEVVYWKDTEDPGVRRVLWSARTDAAFCKRKAEELTAKLTAVGWTCTPTDAPAPVREAAPQAPAADEPVAPTVTAAPAVNPPVPDPAPVATADPAPVTAAALEAEPAIRQEPEPPHSAAALPAAAPAASALATIIEQNLARLNDGVDGRFDAMIADYGDLDGDGNRDGLVLFTYESQRLGQARFVAAYLYDGESYTLAATKPLAGSEEKVQGAEVESIDEGVISLRLNVLEPGDATCCPSGVRRQALMLRNGQLIEVNVSASTSENRS